MRSAERPRRFVGRRKAEYEYQQRGAALRQADLLRFGIDTVWVDEFAHVEPLLGTLSAYIHRKSVFVSGAAHDAAPLGRDRLDNLSREIGNRLIREGYNLVSGFGLGLGEQCVVGALRALYGVPKGSDTERLVVRPFPRAAGAHQQHQNTRHREELISRCGIVVVIAGNRAYAGDSEISPGVNEEVEIALREGKFVIPIGATGHAARRAWERVSGDQEGLLPGIRGQQELATLGNPAASNEQLLNSLFRLLAKAEKARAV